MRRRLDLVITAAEFKLDVEDVLSTLQEMVETGDEQGIIDKNNKQFYHLTPEEHKNLISLLSKEKIQIEDIAHEMEFPSQAIAEWLTTLIQSKQLQGTFNATHDSFIPYALLLKEVRESFIKSGKLGITEAANALSLDGAGLRNCIKVLSDSGELEGFYTLDNEFFITSHRLREDILDYFREQKRFPLKNLATKLHLNEPLLRTFIENLIKNGEINGVISESNELITDELLDQTLVNAIKPYIRISLKELAEKFRFNERSMKDLIVRAISKGLIFGSIDSISNEFVKERVTEPIKAPISAGAEVIDVKRDYDYIGGDIRFKVALQNTTKTTVSKISVLLNVPDQFKIDKNVEKVEILNPGETRGVDFLFSPLACGKGQIFGTVSYTDAFGEPHSVTIHPKECWVKCPLVKSQLTTVSEADLWKKELQKSSTTVDAEGLTRIETFRIGCEQIAALDLAEVQRDEAKLVASFSGIAKVTGNRLLVEISLKDRLILDVYTSDLKEATGLLAYMRNLIKISLDVSRKLRVKSEKLGLKVLASFQIAKGLFNLCDYCEIHSLICDFLLQMKEIIFKIKKEVLELKFLPPIELWLQELSKLDENTPIPESFANALEYDALEWLNEIEGLTENTAKIYIESFDTPDETRDAKIIGGLTGIRTDIKRRESNYSGRVAHYILVIHKGSGLCLFNYKFSPGAIDPDLMAGFLSAIQSFGTEFRTSAEESGAGMRRLSYKDFEIALEESEYVRVALVAIGKVTTYLEDRLKDFIKLFSGQFYGELANFRGMVSIFDSTTEIIKTIFGTP